MLHNSSCVIKTIKKGNIMASASYLNTAQTNTWIYRYPTYTSGVSTTNGTLVYGTPIYSGDQVVSRMIGNQINPGPSGVIGATFIQSSCNVKTNIPSGARDSNYHNVDVSPSCIWFSN
jgi:hypothetical protein